jgi:membrane associated rhomboid family serine protease
MNRNDQPVQSGTWQRRILWVVLPAGILLLILWVAWAALALIGGEDLGIGWASAAMGLVTSLVLIASGYAYRRDLGAR